MARLAAAKPSQCWARFQPEQRRCQNRCHFALALPLEQMITALTDCAHVLACHAGKHTAVCLTCRQDSFHACSNTSSTASSSWRAQRYPRSLREGIPHTLTVCVCDTYDTLQRNEGARFWWFWQREGREVCFLCKVSCLEIYQEVITDLLCPDRTRLQLREDLRHGIYVENLSEEVVTDGQLLPPARTTWQASVQLLGLPHP